MCVTQLYPHQYRILACVLHSGRGSAVLHVGECVLLKKACRFNTAALPPTQTLSLKLSKCSSPMRELLDGLTLLSLAKMIGRVA